MPHNDGASASSSRAHLHMHQQRALPMHVAVPLARQPSVMGAGADQLPAAAVCTHGSGGLAPAMSGPPACTLEALAEAVSRELRAAGRAAAALEALSAGKAPTACTVDDLVAAVSGAQDAACAAAGGLAAVPGAAGLHEAFSSGDKQAGLASRSRGEAGALGGQQPTVSAHAAGGTIGPQPAPGDGDAGAAFDDPSPFAMPDFNKHPQPSAAGGSCNFAGMDVAGSMLIITSGPVEHHPPPPSLQSVPGSDMEALVQAVTSGTLPAGPMHTVTSGVDDYQPLAPGLMSSEPPGSWLAGAGASGRSGGLAPS